jgi:hypothetical protein
MGKEPTDDNYTPWSQWKQQDYRQMKKDYGAVKNKLMLNMSKLYTGLWNQCDPQMQDVITKDIDYKLARKTKNVIKLFRLIEKFCEIGDEYN